MRPLAMVSEFFIPEVEKRIKAASLNIKINWKEAYAGSLLKPTFVLKGVQDGIADIGFEPTIFHPDKLPLEQISFITPFATSDVVLVGKAIDKLHATFPEYPGAIRQVRRDPPRRIELRLLRAVLDLPGAEVRRRQGQEDRDRRCGAAMAARHRRDAGAEQHDALLQQRQDRRDRRLHHLPVLDPGHEISRKPRPTSPRSVSARNTRRR